MLELLCEEHFSFVLILCLQIIKIRSTKPIDLTHNTMDSDNETSHYTEVPGSPSPRKSRHSSQFFSPNSLAGSPILRTPERSPISPARMQPSPLSRAQLLDIPDLSMRVPVVEKPRLVIRNLVLTNFKSYCGRREVGPFNDNFTAVVGPNGSGKSNVIDSLLFVFGFRAKKMRQDNLKNLIYHSDTYRDIGFCRVEVFFEMTGDSDWKLVVGREVRRDGNNFYTLDGVRSTYTQVTTLLEEKGIDLKHKRFLILQGEVESIALMPPKAEKEGDDGLLEYLEDIIGTSKYKEEIAELESKVDSLRLDCKEKRQRLGIVEEDILSMNDVRKRAENSMKASNRASTIKSQLLQVRKFKSERSLRNAEELKLRNTEKVNLSQSQIAEREQELASLKAELSTSESNLHKLNAELNLKKNQLNEERIKTQKFEKQREMAAKSIEELKASIESSCAKAKPSKEFLDSYDDVKLSLESELQKSSEQLEPKQSELTVAREEISAKTSNLRTAAEELQTKAAPLKQALDAKNAELEQINTRNDARRNILEQTRQEEQKITRDGESLVTEGISAKKEVKKLQNTLSQLEEEESKIDSEIEKFSGLKKEVDTQLANLKTEVSVAREARESSRSQNYMEAELMKLKIDGLYGRLGALGAINEKYDVVISTAAPQLNNFVVDTVATATKCIQALRERNLGRGQFMVLEKIKSASNEAKRSPSEFPAPRLIDLVQCADPIFYKAFYLALGNTLVANNIEEANRIAFSGPKRYRVATLDGAIVNVSGQMSGGGRPMRGLMASSISTVSSEELDSLEQKLVEVELDSAEVNSSLSTSTSRKQELLSLIPATRNRLSKMQLDLSDLEQRMIGLKDRRKAKRAEIAAKEEELRSVEENDKPLYNQLRKESDAIKVKYDAVANELKVIDDQIREAGGEYVEELQKAVQKLSSKVSGLKTKLRNLDQDNSQHTFKLQSFNRDIERLKEQLQDAEAKYELKFKNSEDEDAMDVSVIADLQVQVNDIQEQYTEQKQSISKAKEQQRKLTAENYQLNLELNEASLVLSRTESEIVGYKQTIQSIESKAASLQLYNVDYARDCLAKTVKRKRKQSRTSQASEYSSQEPPSSQGTQYSQSQPLSQNELTQASDVNPSQKPLITEFDEVAFDAEQPLLPYEDAFNELTPDELEEIDEKHLQTELAKAERDPSYEQLINLEGVDKYRARYKDYMSRKQISDEADNIFDASVKKVKSLHDTRYSEFMIGFHEISSKLKELYRAITMGGNAELELVDNLDPFAEGILFSVMPPKKSWRNIANLSGGEKTLSSLALVFALHHYKPTPLYVMDEIDAALDYRNVSIIANYIKERTKDAQFIVISLRMNMFELASRLVGIYKNLDVSMSATLQVD